MISLEFFGIFLFLLTRPPLQQQLASANAELEQNQLHSIRPGGVTAAKLLNKLGYAARDFEFTTKDGYILNIVRATNPLIAANVTSHLCPILFVHGTFMGATTMLGSTHGAQPRNFRTHGELRNMTHDVETTQLIEIVGEDPSQRSLPLLALNLGYEIWLLNRRGSEKSKKLARRSTPRTLSDALVSLPAALDLFDEWLPEWAGSRLARALDLDMSSGRISLVASLLGQFWSTALGMPRLISPSGPVAQQIIETLDPEFWSSSLDEQIAHDLPEAVDFVLEQTGKLKVHTVGYSSGGALILLAAAEQPKLAEKVASAVLWSPSVHMEDSGDLAFLAPLLAQSVYLGPVPPAFVRRQLIGLAQFVCDNELAQRTICSRFLDFFLGYSGLEAPVVPSVSASVLQPVSSRELSHLYQMAAGSRERGPCKFRFSTREKNAQVYGPSGEPPCYKLARVNLTNLSIYVGEYDSLISPSAVEKTVSQLAVAPKLKVVGESGVHFNHAGPLFHDEAGRLLIVPSMADIERVEREMRQTKRLSTTEDEALGTCSLGPDGKHHFYADRISQRVNECAHRSN